MVSSIFELHLLKWTRDTVHFKTCLVSHDAFLNSVQEFVITNSYPVCLFDQLMKQMHELSRFGEFSLFAAQHLYSSIHSAMPGSYWFVSGFLFVCLFVEEGEICSHNTVKNLSWQITSQHTARQTLLYLEGNY